MNESEQKRSDKAWRALAIEDAECDARAATSSHAPITLADLDAHDPRLREAGREWESAKRWRWVDAVAWVGTFDPEMMVLVRAYRYFGRSQRWDAAAVEAACRTMLQEHLGAKLVEVESKLHSAVEDGNLAVQWGPNPEPILSATMPAANVQKWANRQRSQAVHFVPVAEPAEVASASTAKAIYDCKVWLKEELARPVIPGEGRDHFKALALAKFDKLSGRGFRTAWAAVAPDFPERQKAGPKKQRR